MMKDLPSHARLMRASVYNHMLATRGWKYKAFLRYLRIFKYISFTPLRGEFLESFYTLMRYLDDIVDGDASLPQGFDNPADYIVEKIAFSEHPNNPVDEVDYLMLHCFQVAADFREDFSEETRDILFSLLFDARRRDKLIIFTQKELNDHFHLLDIDGTIKATLKIFKEDPSKYVFLEPLGMASRYEYDLEDFYADIQAGYINIPAEDFRKFGITLKDLHDKNSEPVKNWCRQHAEDGLGLLEEHHRRLPKGKFSLLAKCTFPLVYELPAKRFFQRFLTTRDMQKIAAYEPALNP